METGHGRDRRAYLCLVPLASTRNAVEQCPCAQIIVSSASPALAHRSINRVARFIAIQPTDIHGSGQEPTILCL
jgi:hypothetical protein